MWRKRIEGTKMPGVENQLQFTPTPVFEKFLFDKGANCNRKSIQRLCIDSGEDLYYDRVQGITERLHTECEWRKTCISWLERSRYRRFWNTLSRI
jgi:hypothetical protein